MIVLAGIVAALVAAVVILIIWLIVEGQKTKSAEAKVAALRQDWADYQLTLPEREKEIRADAIARSTSVVKGKVAEQMVPFAANFGFNPRDCRFIGSPVDFLVLEGMTEGDLERIILIEVKTGLSRLSKRERQIRDAVHNGEYAFLTCRVLEDGSLEWSS